MRKIAVSVAVAALAIFAGSALMAEEEAAWMDPVGCYFCQPLSMTEGLLDNLGWESHKIKNGVVQVVTYKPEWKEKYKAAWAEMENRWKAYDPAKQYHLCGMCQAWMKIPLDKVAWEDVQFNGGEISIGVSQDSAIVVQMHDIADKTCAAMDEMKKAETAPKQ